MRHSREDRCRATLRSHRREIEQAKADFALHIPSLFTRQCLAEECGDWPCRRYVRAVAVLDRAGLLDVNGQLRA